MISKTPFTCLLTGCYVASLLRPATARCGRHGSHKAILVRIKSGWASLALLASIACLSSLAPAQTSYAWQPYGISMRNVQNSNGLKINNLDSSNQVMTSKVTLSISKYVSADNTTDYYLVSGPFSHSVTTPSTVPNGKGPAWQHYQYPASIPQNGMFYQGYGWCGASMTLDLAGFDTTTKYNPANLLSTSPTSSSDLQSSTVTDTSIGTDGLGTGYSTTFTAPDVALKTLSSLSDVSYAATLQCPSSFVGAYTGGFPDPTSAYGTTLETATVYEVSHGSGFILQWDDNVSWNFLYSQSQVTEGNSVDTNYTYTNSNGAAGSIVADFGVPPNYSNGSNQPANGPQIVDDSGNCLSTKNTGVGAGKDPTNGGPVLSQPCSTSSSYQKWYYTAASQIVNVKTGMCLDIEGGYPQGGAPATGAILITNTCAPALPTSACVASSSCVTSSGAPSQQWQLSYSGNFSAVTPNTSNYALTSSSGYVVNASAGAANYTLQPASSATNFTLHFPANF